MGIGKEQRSTAEHIANRTFDNLIPYMKYTTYEMYAPKFGGRAAGGVRQRGLRRAERPGYRPRIALGPGRHAAGRPWLPDWQEGWARPVGNGLVQPGSRRAPGEDGAPLLAQRHGVQSASCWRA